MKKVLLLALVFSGISFLSLAQESPTRGGRQGMRMDKQKQIVQKSPEEIAKFQTERMTKELNLTESQQKDIYALQLKNAQKRKEHIESTKKDREKRRADMLASKEEINSILTSEQQKLLAEKRAEHQKYSKRRMHENRKMKRYDNNGSSEQKRSKSTMKNTSND